MQENHRKILADAISEVMETMFFLCPEPCDPGGGLEESRSPSEVIVHIQTADERPCQIVLHLPVALLDRMAVNVLEGLKESFSRKDLEDVACEFVNMVAGAFLNRLDAPHRKALSLPGILAGVSEDREGWVSYSCEVEGCRLQARLSCESFQEGAAR
jgi:hypothetical protein